MEKKCWVCGVDLEIKEKITKKIRYIICEDCGNDIDIMRKISKEIKNEKI